MKKFTKNHFKEQTSASVTCVQGSKILNSGWTELLAFIVAIQRIKCNSRSASLLLFIEFASGEEAVQ